MALAKNIATLVIVLLIFVVSRFGRIKHFKDSQGRERQISDNSKVAMIAVSVVGVGFIVVLAFFLTVVAGEGDAAVAVVVGSVLGLAVIVIPIVLYAKIMKTDENFYAEDEKSFVLRRSKKKIYTVMYDDIISYDWVIAGHIRNQVRITTEEHKAVYVHLIKYHPVRLLQALRDMEEDDRFNKGKFAYKDRLNTLDRMIEEHSRLLHKQSS